MLQRGQTTEERIAKIAQGFGQGLQNYQQGQDKQRAQGLQEEALRRQQALQELDIEGKLSEQTGKSLIGSGIGKQYLSGGMPNIGELMKSAPTTRKAELESQDRQIKAEDRILNNQYKQSQIDRNNRKVGKGGSDGEGEQLKANEVAKFNEGNSIPSMLKDVEVSIEKNKDLFGPIKGRIGSLNPYDERYGTIGASIRASAQAFGKYMEGGVLRREDEVKYERMFPNISDTPEIAKNKLAIVNRLLIQKQNSTVGALKDAGYNTSAIDKKFSVPERPDALNGAQVDPAKAIQSASREELIKFLQEG